jgi:hypothetical protein
MRNFLDDDNDFGNQSHNRGLNFINDPDDQDDFADDDFADEAEQADDGEMDSQYDRDLESENTDDDNF